MALRSLRGQTHISRNGVLTGAAGALIAAFAATVQGQDKTPELSTSYYAEIGAGAEYDSNVTVDELDITSNESDYGLTLDASIGLKKPLTNSTELSLSYDFSQTNYKEFSEVDRQTHLVGADLSTELGEVDTGLSTFYIHSRLDGNKFLELYRGSPYVSGFISKRWFTRGAYVYSDKTIENRPARDATTQAGELDFYYFRRGLRSYFNIGYRYRDENAEDDQFDYQSNSAKLRYVQRIELLDRTTKLELSWRFEDRDYSGVTPSIGEKRDEDRNRWRIDYEVPILEQGMVLFYYGYSDYDSNLPSADYTQSLLGARFTYRWE
ncbi:MAG: surface lipoprotein assembly modifier [Halioglobus sp.]